MNLTSHITLEELIHSDLATRKGIDNAPDAEVQSCLQLLANGLERVRLILSVPLYISSGYRSPKLNAAVGGAKVSAHMKGLAADFTAPGYGSPDAVCQVLVRHAVEIGYDQLIMEGKWVHIAFPDDSLPKLEVLTAHFSEFGVTYTKGLS